MDYLKKLTDFLLKYRWAVLVLAVGLVLMLLPTGEKNEQAVQPTLETEERDLSGDLEELLAQIQGVGRVKVLMTLEAGEQVLYQTDEDDTVIITDGDRAEAGLVQQVLPERYRGAVVVCQGADSAAVRLSVIEAVAAVTGLSTDRITVLKMK